MDILDSLLFTFGLNAAYDTPAHHVFSWALAGYFSSYVDLSKRFFQDCAAHGLYDCSFLLVPSIQ